VSPMSPGWTKSVRSKSVTHVLGTLCHPCVRVGPESNGGADGIRTHDLLDAIEARSQLRHGPTELVKFTTGIFVSKAIRYWGYQSHRSTEKCWKVVRRQSIADLIG
jgi:hypothetical protein